MMRVRKKYSVILCILAVFYSAFLLMIPVFTSRLVNSAVDASKLEAPNLRELYFNILFVVIAIIMDIVLYALEQFLYFRFSVIREKELKEDLFYSIYDKEVTLVSNYHTAMVEQLFTTDIQNVIHKELDTIPRLFKQMTRLVLAVVIVVFIDVWFLALIFVCGVIGFLLAKLYSKWIRPHHHEVLEKEGKFNGYILEGTAKLKLLQAYDAKSFSNSHFDSLNEDQLKAKKKRNRIFFLANSGLFSFSSLIYLFALCYGGYGIATKALTYGSMIALVQLLNNIQAPLLSFSSLWNQFNLAKASKKRIEGFYHLDKRREEGEASSFTELVFDNVSFSYGEKKIIHNLSFQIKPCEYVLFQGPSGIGKTTLFMLLLGFITPSEGRIYFKNGDEEFPLTKNMFSYVPQENSLFSGTILENIYILTGKNEEEAISALRLTNVYEELCLLPEGLHTVLKENGNGLSLGQIQRILIAIAILRDRPILLLDEFSSALDKKNEEEIIERLSKMNKTILYISHRSQALPNKRVIELGKDAYGK